MAMWCSPRLGCSLAGPEQDQDGDKAGGGAAYSTAQGRAERGVLGSLEWYLWEKPRCGFSVHSETEIFFF